MIVKSFVAAGTITEFAAVAFDSNGKVVVATDATSDLTDERYLSR